MLIQKNFSAKLKSMFEFLSGCQMTESQLKLSSYSDLVQVISCGELTSHSNPLSEITVVRNGVNASGVYAFASLMGWDMATVANALGTTSATLSRCKSKSLSSQTSEHAIEVARLSMIGINYFGCIENWNVWLNTAHTVSYTHLTLPTNREV